LFENQKVAYLAEMLNSKGKAMLTQNPSGSWYFGKFLNPQMPSAQEQPPTKQDEGNSRPCDLEEVLDDDGNPFGSCGFVIS
jgi:hypothetical protein